MDLPAGKLPPWGGDALYRSALSSTAHQSFWRVHLRFIPIAFCRHSDAHTPASVRARRATQHFASVCPFEGHNLVCCAGLKTTYGLRQNKRGAGRRRGRAKAQCKESLRWGPAISTPSLPRSATPIQPTNSPSVDHSAGVASGTPHQTRDQDSELDPGNSSGHAARTGRHRAERTQADAGASQQ